MRKAISLLLAVIAGGSLLVATQQPAQAAVPIYSFTVGDNYCGGAFHENGTQGRLRAYINAQADGSGQTVRSVHIWANQDPGCDGSDVRRCGPGLESPAASPSRIRIWGVNTATGDTEVLLDRNAVLNDANNCDYLAGDTQNWSTNFAQVTVRWDFTIHAEKAEDPDGYYKIWRKKVPVSVDPDGEQWGCEINGNVPKNLCYSEGPF